MSDWYPWYPVLFKADTLHLTAAQDGIYRRLIDWYMETRRPLPDNDQALAGIARVGLQEWLDVAAIVRPYFFSKAGKLHQKRCDNELDRQDKFAARRSEVGRKGAEARHSKNKEIDALGMPEADLELAEGIDEASLEQALGMPQASPRLGTSLLHDRTVEDNTKKESKTENKKVSAAPERASGLDEGGADFPLSQVKAPDGDWSLVLFRQGLSWLAHGTGKPPDKLRSVLGKWLRDMGGDHRALFDIFAVAERDAIAAPVEWITKVVAMRAKQMQRPAPGSRMPNGQGPRPRQWSVAERIAKIAEWKMQLAAPAAIRARVAQEGLSDVWGDT